MAPQLPLQRFVEDVRVLTAVDGCERQVERLPDGRTLLVFRELESDRQADVSVAGPRTQRQLKRVSGVARSVIVQFKPGWSGPLLGVGANTLTDRIIPLEAIWGNPGRDLCRELAAAQTVPDVLERLSRAIAVRLQETLESATSRLARRAIRLLEAGEVRVDRIARQLGVSERHLRRAFASTVGIGPKDFARGIRLQRAVREAASTNDWSRIAADAGYYDQSHLIADFRKLTGLTPEAFSKARAS